MKRRIPSLLVACQQAGLARPGLIALIAVLVAAGAGGWWWTQRGGGASGGPADAASAASGPGGLGGAGGSGSRRFGGASRTQPVSVMAARQQDIRVLITAIGNISALNTAVVRARVDGELKAIRFREGQQVRAGAVLAEIDPRSYEIALAQAQGQLARDQAQLRNAQVDLDRYKELLAKDSIARQQVDTQDALVRQLVGTVQTDQAQVDNAKLQLSYTRVTAPISGRLGLKQADLGNMVHASDANGLVSITQTQPIAVVFAVPEASLPQINRRLKANEPLTVEAWDRELRNRLASGKVSTTDNAIDPVTGTIKLKAEFANADGTLFPNQFVNIRLQVDTLAGALTVPTSAIQRGAQGIYVYVVKEDSTVTVRRVRTGATENEWVSVQGDLAPGERVVTDGADRLREGAKVEVIAAPSRAPGLDSGGTRDGGSRRERQGSGAQQGAAAASGAVGNAPAARDGTPQKVGPAGAASNGAAAGSTGGGKAEAAKPAEAPAAKGTAWIDQLPPQAQERVRRVMERLPPDVAERVNHMQPEERRAFFQKLREQRQQSGNN